MFLIVIIIVVVCVCATKVGCNVFFPVWCTLFVVGDRGLGPRRKRGKGREVYGRWETRG